jgi:hypothetical protein
MHGTLALFMYMVMQASHKDMKIGTQSGIIELKRGQFISGRHKLSAAVGMSEQSARTCIERLHGLDIVTSESTSHFTLYTIVNYGQYQDIPEAINQQINQQVTSHQPTGNQQVTTKQELSNTISIEETPFFASYAGRPPCPHEQIISLYHELLPTLPAVKVWNDKRKTALKSRWLESEDRQTLDFWRRYFKYVAQSDFLCGRAGTFQATLEWLVNSSNFVKVIEGNYENRKQA